MSNQPIWKLVAQLGDVNPVSYGGYFVYIDETGVYSPEAELLVAPDDDEGTWTVYRFSLDPCTFIDGILSDNKFHPAHAAWFAKPEAEKVNRRKIQPTFQTFVLPLGSSRKNSFA